MGKKTFRDEWKEGVREEDLALKTYKLAKNQFEIARRTARKMRINFILSGLTFVMLLGHILSDYIF